MLPIIERVKKYVGKPTAAAHEKQMSCRFVSPSATLVLTLERSFGTGTNGIYNTSLSFFADLSGAVFCCLAASFAAAASCLRTEGF